MYIALFIVLPLLIGWILDLRYGDPERGFHPIVVFGKVIAWGERKFNNGSNRKAKGAVFSSSLIVGTFILTLAVISLLTFLVLNYAFNVVMSLLLIGFLSAGVFYCLAGKTLRREVRMVFEACDRSLEDGRKQVGRIVGRDTSGLSLQEVRAAALETLAENLSDGVIAPLFWYMLLGLPGMMTYKMINTLDSMIGYQNERYKDFGCFAAKMDDVANYIPARLTAFLMVVVSGRWGVLKFVKRYGRMHASPNSGYPESALAGILNCRFGGPHNYFGELFWKPFIGDNERPLSTEDMEQSILINKRVEFVTVLAIVAILLIVAIFSN